MARESDEEILRVASSLWVERYHLEPTDDDIREMHKAIGKEQCFLGLSYENKAPLFRGMLRVHRINEMYRDLIDAGTEDPGPMQAALENFVTLEKKNGAHLSMVASRWAKRLGIEQGVPALWHMASFLSAVKEVVQISRTVAGEPKSRDERHTRPRQTKTETDGIVAILKKVGVNIDGKTNGKSKEARLAGAIVGYTRGKKISGGSFVKRLSRMTAS
jgi:hypothetical protein